MNALFRHLLAALLAALGSVPWMISAAPLFGWKNALGAYALGAAAFALAVTGPSWARGLRVALVAAAAGLSVAVLAPGLGIPAAVLVLAIGRSGFLWRRKPLRALAVEIVLCVGGLLFARYMYFSGPGPTLLGTAWAVWGFGLVQAGFPLLGGLAPRSGEETRTDPFDEARRRALELMEG